MNQWQVIFELIRAGGRFDWDDVNAAAGADIKNSRGAFARAKLELETVGLRVKSQDRDGFDVVAV